MALLYECRRTTVSDSGNDKIEFSQPAVETLTDSLSSSLNIVHIAWDSIPTIANVGNNTYMLEVNTAIVMPIVTKIINALCDNTESALIQSIGIFSKS